MEMSVKLQEPFSYALWPVVLSGMLVVLAALLYIIILKIRKNRKEEAAEPLMIKQSSPQDVAALKGKYIGELEQIKMALCNGKISTRTAYQNMSRCIREFVYQVTGIQVQNYTLQDIRQLHMPVLEELIVEYYTPEFAMQSVGDGTASIEKTKRAIERWN